MDEAVGSIPTSSTADLSASDAEEIEAWMLGGFVAGEGCFTTCRQPTRFADGSHRTKFVFCISVARRDVDLLERLRRHLGGGIRIGPAAKEHHQPVARFAVRSHLAHHTTTIPFMERYLLPSAKRRQFEAWRQALLDYEIAHPTRWGRGRATCSETDCDLPVRGRGLCRSHYYHATGH